MDLGEIFCRCCCESGLQPRVEDPWNDLVIAYQTPPREYHNILHILNCVLTGVSAGLSQLSLLALFYHDAVYLAGNSENEEASCRLFTSHFQCEPDHPVSCVTKYIMATKHEPDSAISDPRAAMVADIDMSILGQDWDAFNRYDRAIRREWKHVPDNLYERGRIAFLEELLGRKEIFLTYGFHNQLESKARANILARLTG